MIFEWSAEYEIGLPEIDAQHRGLVEMLNELYAAKQAGQGATAARSTIERLLQYTQEHFEAEEWAMKRAHYPGYALHHKQHQILTRQVVDMLGAADALPAFELLNFLSDWLKQHIGHCDREFGQYIRAQQNATLSPPPLG